MWTCLEENYLQATEDREMQLKRLIQNTRKGNQTLEEYLRVFKKIFDGLATKQSPVADDGKVLIYFKTLERNMMCLSLVCSLNLPFLPMRNLLLLYDLRLQNTYNEYKVMDQNMAFLSQKSNGGRGRGNGRGRGGNTQFNSRGRGFTPAGQIHNFKPQGGNPPNQGPPVQNNQGRSVAFPNGHMGVQNRNPPQGPKQT